MIRHSITPRPDWQTIVESQGFVFHSQDNPYWDESACYEFSAAEIDKIEAATAELFDLCVEAVEYVIEENLFSTFHIPESYIPFIIESWEEDYPSIYGRFDLAYNGEEIKLLEYNADTPTALLEASVIQWFWLQDFNARKDQFNSIHEKLIDCWKAAFPYLYEGPVHFTCIEENVEDFMTVAYLMDCCKQAGHEAHLLFIEDIGYDMNQNRFFGAFDEPIKNIFKLYPYEWMLCEEFGRHLVDTRHHTIWIEPGWKMIASNKRILKTLWDLFPNHPLLLPCTLDAGGMHDYVRKPFFSREGANIDIYRSDLLLASSTGEREGEGWIYQQYFPIPTHDGNTPIIGSWIIGDAPAGIGIRESKGLITDNLSRFVPHYFGD